MYAHRDRFDVLARRPQDWSNTQCARGWRVRIADQQDGSAGLRGTDRALCGSGHDESVVDTIVVGMLLIRPFTEESEVPLRSHGSLSMNRALMAAGLVDRVQLSVFPVITAQTGVEPIFQGAADLDLELIENRTLDGRTHELIYRPTLHV